MKKMSLFENRITQGIENKVFIIAEMACAHDGDINKAKKLIDVSVVAKADSVQLQFFRAMANVTRSNELFPILTGIEFTDKQWTELAGYARSKNIMVFACAYDMPSLELAIQLKVDGIKFNSADLTNYEMLDVVTQSGVPFTLGTGASTMEEIGSAVQRVRKQNNSADFILMHGMQSFPTSISHANLLRIPALAKLFHIAVGYADHTSGENSFAKRIDLIAVGLGASVLEKHITLNRADQGLDYQAALEPKEFEAYVSSIRISEQALGAAMVKEFDDSEICYRQFQKKQITAKRSLPVGHVLNRNDLDLLRDSSVMGLTADKLEQVIGQTLSSELPEGNVLKQSNLENIPDDT